MDFVILSNQQFDFPLKTNKWQVATRLAKLNHRVIFVDPPIRLRKALKSVVLRKQKLRDLLIGCKKVSENLYVFIPVTLTPTEKPNIFSFNFSRLTKLIKKLNFQNFVLWVYHQVMTDYVSSLKYKTLVYDCVDEYSKFPNFVERGLSEYVSNAEEFVARKSNIVFATTENLVKKMKKFNNNVCFTPNVGDYERFKDVGTGRFKVPAELKKLKRPIIGFSGAIDAYKLNLNLVLRCAKTYPMYSFVLVGPKGVSESKTPAVLKELKSFENVHFLGERPYAEMPLYFEGFDEYIIPYNLNEYTVWGCFPVKFHDALSAGLPTVVTALPSYKPFKDVCYIAENEEDFVRLIEKVLKEDSDDKTSQRKKVARKNSWDEKVLRMLNLIVDVSGKN